MKLDVFVPAFVEFVPRELSSGVLYLALEHAVAAHLCACGCDTKVVTPFSPAGWQLFFDGDSVSLTPSIGNWQFPCRSHYWIRGNRVQWAAPMSDVAIALGRRRDARQLETYFALRQDDLEAADRLSESGAATGGPLRRVWRRLRRP